MTFKRTLIAFAPALIWAIVVLYIGGRSSVPVPEIELSLPIDKIGHFVMYGILGLLAGRGARRVRERISWIWFIVAGLLLGALDEFQQYFIPSRTADPLDWVADAAGFTFGFWLVYTEASSLLTRWRKRG